MAKLLPFHRQSGNRRTIFRGLAPNFHAAIPDGVNDGIWSSFLELVVGAKVCKNVVEIVGRLEAGRAILVNALQEVWRVGTEYHER